MNKFFNLGVDIKNEHIKVLEGIFAGDCVTMRLTLSDCGKRINYTGVQVIRLTVRKGDYTTVETAELLRNIQRAEAENGIIEFELPQSFTSDKGMHQLQLTLTASDGQMSCARVNYIVASAGEDAEISEEDIKTYGELLTAVSDILDGEDVRINSEKARAQAEEERQSAENERDNSEKDRNTAEAKRVTSENNRINAETSRDNAEKDRQANENKRVSAEAERDTAETTRMEAETARNEAENNRASSESLRVYYENARNNSEKFRSSNEIDRRSNETSRAEAENARAAAETERASSETDRQSAESERQAAESARAEAETARDKAEAARAEAEENRSAELAKKADREEIFDKLCPHGEAESASASVTVTDGLGGTVLRDWSITGAEGGVGDLNSETGKYDIPVTVRGQNLFKSQVTENYLGSNRILVQPYGGGKVAVIGSPLAQYFNYVSLCHPCTLFGSGSVCTKVSDTFIPKSNSFVISWEHISGNNAFDYIILTSTDGNTYGITIKFSDGFVKISARDYDVCNIYFRFPHGSNAYTFNDVYRFQVTLGTEVLPFEPYGEPQTVTVSLDAPLGAGESMGKINTGTDIPLVTTGANIIDVSTTVAPGKVAIDYYKDINTVIKNINKQIAEAQALVLES